MTRNLIRARARLRFSPRRANTRADRLRDRQQLFLRQELVEQLRLVRHRAEAAADVELEAALPLPSTIWVLAMAPRSWMFVRPQAFCCAAREGDLELAAEVLRVGVAQQEERQALA